MASNLWNTSPHCELQVVIQLQHEELYQVTLLNASLIVGLQTSCIFILGLANSQPTGPAKSLSVWCSKANLEKSCVEHHVNYLTRQGHILLRCYFLGRQALRRPWGCTPAFRSSLVPQLAQRQELGSQRLVFCLARSAGCALLPTCLVLPPVRGCDRICLVINIGRELVQNWIIFKNMAVWARPTVKHMLGKKSSLAGRWGEIPTSCCGAGFVPGRGVKCPLFSWLSCACAQCFCRVWMLASCKTMLFYS